jgi:hypothetical protein
VTSRGLKLQPSTRFVRDAPPTVVMIASDDIRPCWNGDIDVTSLRSLLQDSELVDGETEGVIRGMRPCQCQMPLMTVVKDWNFCL